VLPLIPPLPSLMPLLQSWFDRSLLDGKTLILLVAILLVLGICWIGSRLLRRQPAANLDAAIIRTFDNRVSAWLTICLLLAVTMMFGQILTVVFFFFVSFWALREFITMTPTRRGDHRTLFWVFFLFTPLQYVMVALDKYQLYTIVIPVYASLFIPGRIAMTGDTKRFLERIAKIQFGLLICVYALSHAPALLYLKLHRLNLATYEWEEWDGKPAGVLLFFVVMVQVSDTLHFAWDRLFGKHVIAPTVNSTRTWEGIIGAAVGTAVAGMLIQLLLPVTPFTWYGAGIMAALISVMASSGSMTMSAIKRDRGVKDYGTLVQGHAGVLDRIDSVCFAAPIFFHVTRFFLERPEKAAEVTRELTSLLPF
jgi:phosphatidate cytidylyltransferase